MAGLLLALGALVLAFAVIVVQLADTLAGAAGVHLGVAAVLLAAAAAVALRPRRRRPAALSRKLRLRVAVRVVASLALGAAVAVAGARLESQWDLTPESRYTLGEYSREVLARLATDVEARVAPEAAAPASASALLLARYAEASARFHVVEAQRPAGTDAPLVLRGAGRSVPVPVVDERRVTQALLAFTEQEPRVACFTAGHGEPALDERGPRGLAVLARLLEAEGIAAEPLPLAALSEVPEACAVVVIAAPRKAFLPGEETVLARWLGYGGRLLVLLEPGGAAAPAHVLERLGIAAPDAVVDDPEARLYGGRAQELLVARFTRHPLTAGLGPQAWVLFAGARPLALSGRPAQGIVWSERAARLHGSAAPSGPFALAAAARIPAQDGQEARAVVFGDADFATNRYLGVLYNEDLILNAVQFLAGREHHIAVRPKPRALYQYPLAPERALAAYQSLALLVPEVLLALAVVTWWRRRRQ